MRSPTRVVFFYGIATFVGISGCSCGDDPTTSPASLRLSPTRLTLRSLERKPVQVLLVRADGAEEDISARAEYSSSDPTIADVARGQVVGLAAGRAQVRVEADGIEATLEVTVDDRRLLSLSLDPLEVQAPPGGEAQFEVLARYSDGSVEDVTDRAGWTSGNPGVATIAAGVVSGVSDGFSAVVVEFEGQMALGGIRVGPNRFESSPHAGETSVAVTRESVVTFAFPLAPGVVPTEADVYAEQGGQRWPGRLHLSKDRRRLTLFYTTQLPDSARVTLTVVGDRLTDASGRGLDADGDGLPGGTKEITFDTLSLSLVPGTAVYGRVFASELSNTGSEWVNVPLAGVRISVDGIAQAQLSALTDAMGNFRLEPAPAGRFFVHIDGRSSPQTSGGDYYPEVTKAWVGVPETEVSVGEIYLPKILAGTINLLNPSGPTTISFPPAMLALHPELADVSITVPEGSLYADDGTVGGGVGIAPVPPDRIPSRLPATLGFSLVITVQTDGPTNFDLPVQACFPNLPGAGETTALPPGARTTLFSFSHDKGEFELASPARVSADGRLVCTVAGSGIHTPGWHGTSPNTPANPGDPKAPQVPRPPRGGGGGGQPEMCPKIEAPGFWDSFGALTSCIADFFEVSGKLKAVIDILKEGARLVSIIEALALDYQEHNLQLGILISSLDHALEAKKLLVADLAKVLMIVNPADKASKVLACGTSLLTVLEPTARTVLACPEKYGIFMAVAAETILKAKEPLEMLKMALDYFSTFIVSAPFAPVCIAGDQASAAMKRELAMCTPNCLVVAQDPSADEAIDALLGELGRFKLAAQTALPMDPAEGILLLEELTRTIGDADRANFGSVPNAYLIESHDSFSQRLKADPNGNYGFFMPAETDFSLKMLDPVTLRCGGMGGISATPGRPTLLSGVALGPCGDTDSDLDGLTDEGEIIVGTSTTNPDSDGDGVYDGAELQQGRDPLDGIPTRVGILASVDTPDEAIDICGSESLVAIADTSTLRIYNAYRGLDPIVVAAFPAGVTRVACDGLKVAGASPSGELVLVNVDGGVFRQITRPISAGAVALADDLVYLGAGPGLTIVDWDSGEVIGEITARSAQDIGVGDAALLVREPNVLQPYDLAQGLFGPGAAATVTALGPPRGSRMFVGLDRAFATHQSGYDSFDLADPLAPSVISVTTTQLGWRHVVADERGFGVAAVGPNVATGQDVELYDLRDPANPQLATTIVTPGDASAVLIHEGLAYVADGRAGFHVLNYAAADLAEVAPVVEVRVPASLAVRTPYTVTVLANDDGLIRNVELWADDERLTSDGSYPFQFRLRAPIAPGVLRLRARAFDRGNNSTLSSVVEVTVTADAAGPLVIASAPNGVVPTSTTPTTLRVTFDELLDLDPAPAGPLGLVEAGPDDNLGTADDVAIPLGTVIATSAGRHGRLLARMTNPLPAGRYRAAITGTILDLSGNPAAPQTFDFEVRAPATGGGIVSRDRFGNPVPGSGPNLSFDGRYTVFDSSAADIVAGDTGTPTDVFVFDQVTGVIEKITPANADNSSDIASISADGRYVAFQSFASNLVANDTNGARDSFRADRMTGTIIRVSLSEVGGELPQGAQGAPQMSANGRWLIYSLPGIQGPFNVARYDAMNGTVVYAVGSNNDYPLAVGDDGTMLIRRNLTAYVVNPEMGLDVVAAKDAAGQDVQTLNINLSADGARLLYSLDDAFYGRAITDAVGTLLYDSSPGNNGVVSADANRKLLRNPMGVFVADIPGMTTLPVDTMGLTTNLGPFAISGDGLWVAAQGNLSAGGSAIIRVAAP